jgi:hypothetical protein
MNVENQRLKEQVDKLRIDCNALEEHVVQLKQKQYKQEVVLFFFFLNQLLCIQIENIS